MNSTFHLNPVPIVLIIFIFFSCSCSSNPYNITYNNNRTFDNINCVGAYDDGTLLLDMNLEEGFVNVIANFRLIHPNGTFNRIDIKIPCASCVNYTPRLLNPNHILIYYTDSEYNEYLGTLFDWTGKVISNKKFGKFNNYDVFSI